MPSLGPTCDLRPPFLKRRTCPATSRSFGVQRLRASLETDPKEDLVLVFVAQTPGAIRGHYRQVIDVYRAIVD